MQFRSAASHFIQGAAHVLKGNKEFYTRPRLWPYAILPLICVKLVFSGVTWLLFKYVVTPLSERLEEALCILFGSEGIAQSFETGLRWLFIIMLFILFASLTNTLFELFGGLFFARMARRFEKLAYGLSLPDSPGLMQELANSLICILYAATTLLLSLLLLAVGNFFPLIGQILAVVLIGYRYGIGYCSEAGFSRGYPPGRLSRLFKSERRLMLFGFGMACFIVLMAPLVSILFVPGMVIGGTMLVHNAHEALEKERTSLDTIS